MNQESPAFRRGSVKSSGGRGGADPSARPGPDRGGAVGTAETLTLWGILRAAEVVEIAASVGIDLAAAATMLIKESGGGRNIWGHDGAPTAARSDAQGLIYDFGGPVTRDNYLRYRAAQDAGRIPAQGCGPAQLTYPPLQRHADQLGGCWDWRTNLRVGFAHLRDLQRRYGLEPGFRAYNGGDQAARAGVVQAADRYGRESMELYAKWRTRLGANPTIRDEVDMATLDELRLLVRDVLRGELAPVVSKLLTPLPTRADFALLGYPEPAARAIDDLFGTALNADARAYETRQLVLDHVLPMLEELRSRQATTGAGGAPIDPQALAAALADELAHRLTLKD